MLDGNSRLNLATFCQNWVEPEVHKLMNECIDKNIVDKEEYPQTAANTIGCSTTGSSEAAMNLSDSGGAAACYDFRDLLQHFSREVTCTIRAYRQHTMNC